MKKHYELTGVVKTDMLHQTFHQIRACVDIPIHNVSAGDIGGWITLDSVIGEHCWVAEEATLQSSTLKGVVFLSGSVSVLNSHLSGTCEIKERARILNSTVKHVEMNGETCIHSSTIDNELLTILHLTEQATIVGSKIQLEAGKTEFVCIGMTMDSNSLMEFSNISGFNLSFLNNTVVKRLKVKGEDIALSNINYLSDSEIQGSRIKLNCLKESKELHVNGNDILIEYASILNSHVTSNLFIQGVCWEEIVTVHNSFLENEAISIFGQNILEYCNFHKEPEGKTGNIRITGKNTFHDLNIIKGVCYLIGENEIDDLYIDGDIIIEGKNKIVTSSITGQENFITGRCIIEGTLLYGNKNQVKDYVSIEGKESHPVRLAGNVSIQDVVSISKDNTFQNVAFYGDMKY